MHGTTYLAEQEEQPRFVSLKILDDGAAERAERSINRVRNILMGLRHPAVVQVISMDFDHRPRVAAAYVQGRKVSAAVGDPRRGFGDLLSVGVRVLGS